MTDAGSALLALQRAMVLPLRLLSAARVSDAALVLCEPILAENRAPGAAGIRQMSSRAAVPDLHPPLARAILELRGVAAGVAMISFGAPLWWGGRQAERDDRPSSCAETHTGLANHRKRLFTVHNHPHV